jgi:hypothetical protein
VRMHYNASRYILPAPPATARTRGSGYSIS